MSMQHCFRCGSNIDTDYNAEHFDECGKNGFQLLNQESFEKLGDKTREKFLAGDLYEYSNAIHKFYCTNEECGKRVNSAILNYYRWDINNVKCYDCQNNNK